jgi:hypothetical protein
VTTPPFAKRALTITFKLGQGSFGNSGYNTVTLKGLRCFFQGDSVVLPTPPTIVLRVWGMTLDQMNALTVAGLQYSFRTNRVSVEAGELDGAMVQVFEGLIYEAYPEFSNAGDVSFIVLANATGDIQIVPAHPISFKGGTSVETALKAIIKSAGLTLENNGVNTILENPYFPGTVGQQIDNVCRAADCFYYIDSIKKVLAIWPKNKSRTSTSNTIKISPQTGMINYPQFEQSLIRVRTLFDPALHGPTNGQPGTKINIDSQLKAAKGDWTILQMSYILSSELPNGPWELSILANSVNPTIQ